MARRGKDTQDTEPGLWDLAMRDVTPMKGRSKKPIPAPEAAATNRVTPKPDRVTPRADTTASRKPIARDVDRRTGERLDKGKMTIEAVLDLHGHSQASAQDQLTAFIIRSFQRGLRCVLVITGKGKAGGGILRTRLPEWLEMGQLQPMILRVAPAKPRDGGSGAFYVLLRRQRLSASDLPLYFT